MNDARARIYARLMDAQEQIAQARYRQGVTEPVIQAALDAVDDRLSDDERREDLYLAALSRYVVALGGQLEVRAVFDDQAIVVHQGSVR